MQLKMMANGLIMSLSLRWGLALSFASSHAVKLELCLPLRTSSWCWSARTAKSFVVKLKTPSGPYQLSAWNALYRGEPVRK